MQTAKRVDEEKIVCEALVHHLKQHCGCRIVEVARVCKGYDPPDFWITIDCTRYAVEVTSIVTEQGQAYVAEVKKLEEAIRCAAENVLNGTYALIAKQRPLLPQRNSEEWHKLLADTTSFIEKMSKCDVSNEEMCLIDDKGGKLSIKKIDPNGNKVRLIGPIETQWEDKTQQEIKELMQGAIETKRKKLEKKGVPSQYPNIILAFYDAYGFGEISDAKHSFQQTTGYDWFHSIFWAASFNELNPGSPCRDGVFLYSKSSVWRDS